MNAFGGFSAIFHKGDTFVALCLPSYIPNLFWKGLYSKGKEFALKVSKFFTFRVDPFQ